MRAWLSILLMSLLLSSQLLWAEQRAAPDSIRVVSEVWEDYTNADGSGYGWELLRRIFEPAGVSVQIETAPYTRSVGLVQRGERDAWLGAYREEVTGAVFPRWHYDADPVVALGLASSPAPTLDTLGVYRLIWLRGYNYQSQLANARTYQEIAHLESVIDMLKIGRADYYIDVVGVAEAVRSEAPDPQRYKLTALTRLPVYVAFAPNERGRALADLYDRRMQQLVASGELRPIFKRWDVAYPFTQELQEPYGSP